MSLYAPLCCPVSYSVFFCFPISHPLVQEEMMAEMAARNAEARKAAGKPPAQQAPMGA